MGWREAGPSIYSSVKHVKWCICSLWHISTHWRRISLWPRSSHSWIYIPKWLKANAQTSSLHVTMVTAFITAHGGNNPNFYQLMKEKRCCIIFIGTLVSPRKEQAALGCYCISEPYKHHWVKETRDKMLHSVKFYLCKMSSKRPVFRDIRQVCGCQKLGGRIMSGC